MLVTLAGCMTMPGTKPKVTLQFRPGSNTPVEGFTEMTVTGTDHKVFISNEILLSNGDVESSRVVPGSIGPEVEIVFTKTGAEKFTRATEHNIMKPLGILVDGQLICAPIVHEKISGGRAEITGKFSAQEARRIADGITEK